MTDGKHDGLARLSRGQLAELCREYMLAAQFNSRTGYAALRINHGDEAYRDVAIENWMAASPVYTRRMQEAMRLRGTSDVETILKGMQLECGLAHQYFDARFRMVGPEQGEFWLQRCGPLLETEPRGEEAVRLMCHDIEDPTFDATAVATNPRARVRPLHRPPREPADRVPHCHWRVHVDPAEAPIEELEVTRDIGSSLLANIDIVRTYSLEAGGLEYYDGPLFEQMHLERFSHAALLVICKELAVQMHLLVNSLGLAVARRYGAAAAAAVAEFQMAGAGCVVSERLARWRGAEGGGIDAILEVLELHPAFQPGEYMALELHRAGPDTVRIAFPDCPAALEPLPRGWYPLIVARASAGLASLVQGVDPRAILTVLPGDYPAWEISLVEEAAEETLAVQVARGTVLYRTQLESHIQLLELQA